MKTIRILFACALTMTLFTHCTNTTVDQLTSNATSRGNIISELMRNDEYMTQLMDSLHAKHDGGMTDMSSVMMKGNEEMKMKLMDNMMEMCKADTGMFKIMMGKTMKMCEIDETKCKMMVRAMHEHPDVMKSMKMGKMK